MDAPPPPQPPAHEIIRARTPEERQQCYDVRIAVFVAEQRFPLEAEFDEYDADRDPRTAHFLLRLTPSGAPVGTVRAVRPAGAEYCKLSRVAVLAPHRMHRFGAALVREVHAWAAQDALDAGTAAGVGNVLMVCHSQLPAMGFYARLGYTPEGPEFDEDDAPHQKMVLRLPTPTPAPAALDASGSATSP